MTNLTIFNMLPAFLIIRLNEAGSPGEDSHDGALLLVFGSLAIVATQVALDPWLCAAGFRRVCLCRSDRATTRTAWLLSQAASGCAATKSVGLSSAAWQS
jgi:hypothetical protein